MGLGHTRISVVHCEDYQLKTVGIIVKKVTTPVHPERGT